MCWPRKKSERKFKETIRAKTPRKNGHSLQWIIADVNATLRGWFGRFSAQLSDDVPESGFLGAHAFAEHSA